MKDLIKFTLLVSLNIIFAIVVLWSTMIYTSMMSDKLPWYESCGMQFLAILIISCPALIIIGLFEMLLSRFMLISQKLKLLPFACSLGMGLLIFIDQSLGFIMQILGTILGIVTVMATAYFTIKDAKAFLTKRYL
jgi:hypothetical protein